MRAGSFAQQLIAWQKNHGRHDLPWQGRGVYATWVSEIMLQQTQVATVIPYYQRFVARFPDVAALAAASLDDVLGHWSGLGYYTRARNLHRAARIIADQHGGAFPEDFERIRALPGIGRSTAGAICALAFGQPCAILDGNAKRVLARHFAIPGWPGQSKTERTLWQRAQAQVPAAEAATYTQALMDLGATICLRATPRCAHCPVAAGCAAHRLGRTEDYPAARPARTVPQKTATWLVCLHGQDVLLEKRPPSGLWGGMWSFPEGFGDAREVAWALLGQHPDAVEPLPQIAHAFTHFRLVASPVRLAYAQQPKLAGEDRWIWLSLLEMDAAPLPKPVRSVLENIRSRDS